MALCFSAQALLGIGPSLCMRQDRVCHVFWASLLESHCGDTIAAPSSACPSCCAVETVSVPWITSPERSECDLALPHETCQDQMACWGIGLGPLRPQVHPIGLAPSLRPRLSKHSARPIRHLDPLHGSESPPCALPPTVRLLV